MSDEYTLPVNDDIYITGETEEVVPDFSEIDDDDSTQETVTRTPAVISSDNRSSIGSGELNPSPSDVVPSDVSTSDVIVTQRVRHQIDDYEPAALKALSDAGAVFYGVYADGHEEGPVSWTEVHDLDPEGTIIELDEEIASAIAQNFWADTQGVHITDNPYNEWIEAYESNPQFPNLSTSKNYYNILLNAGGALLRRALNNLVSINRTAISFYDGLGNASTNIMAFFGRNGAQIGRSDEKHVVINSSGIGSYNGDGTVADFTMRGSSIVNSTISGSALVDNTITGGKIANATITGAKIDSGTITNANIANGTITGAKIDAGTITNANIQDGTIQGSKIQGSTLTDIPFAAITDAEVEVASIADAQIATATIAEAQVENLSTNYAHLQNGVIDNATIDHADVNGLNTTYATISNLNSATARIGDLEADHVSVDDFEAEQANIDSLQAATADIATIRADSAKVHSLTAAQLSAATAYIAALNADNITAASLSADVGKIHNLTANEISAAAAYIAALNADSVTAQNIIAMNGDFATVKANAAKVANLTAAQLEADHATVGSLDANYAQINMANVNNAWIANGTIKDGAISNGMINSVSANKLTAGTIDASNITVTNLNADNITTGTINGQRIGEGSLSLSKLEEDVYTETEVDNIVSNLQTQIDGAIETWTGTAVPTLSNSPASGWTTNAIKDTHVGDVYFVVNSQSQQNGYNYRFTKSGNNYSWQLIKDSDVTNALQRLTTAEGKIGTIEQFDSDISSWKTDTDEEISSIKSAATTLTGRVSTAEGQIATKVDTTTFNTLSQTVGENSAAITQLTTETTTISGKVDSQNPFIIGTQTAQTGSWTGNAPTLASLVDGQQITYWLPYAPSGNASLNLTLKDGSETGAIPCYYSGTSRLTTHYSANNAIHLTYRTNISGITQGWWADANYDSNTPYTKYSDTVISGKNGLKRYTLCMRDDAGNFTSIVNQANNTNVSGKTCYTGGLQLGAVCYHATGGDYAAGANSGVIYESYGGIDFRYSVNGVANATSTELQLRKPVYLVGTIGADGLFYLDTTKWWTQTSFVEGKAYVLVGTAYSSYYGIFVAVDNPTYIYEDDELVEIQTSRITKTTNKVNTVSDTVDEHTRKIGNLETTVETKADGSEVTTISNRLNTVSETVDGHTQSISSITSTQTTMQVKLDKTLVETTQLWFSKADTTAPNKPTTQVTSTATTGNAWTTVVPAYNANYPNYYYCYQWKYSDGTYGWSSVTRDIATGETQATARQAQNDINNLEIGGRNLLLGTADKFPRTGTSSTYFIEFSVSNGGLKNAVALEEGVEYTFSVDVTTTISNFMISVGCGNGAFSRDIATKPNLGNGRCSITFTPSGTQLEAGTTFAFRAPRYGSINSFTYTVDHPKLERGNKATDWSPAPEDVDADILTAQTSADNAQSTADKNVKSSIQLWFTKANGSAPAKPTAKVTSTSTGGNAWTTVVPTYNSGYPHYFYCWQYELADGTCTWSDVIYDRATTENQSNSRSAVTGVSTLTTKTNNIQDTVDGHTSQLSSITSTQTTIQGNAVKSTVQLWFTKADTTAPAKPTAHVTTNNAATGNAWNLAVPTYNASYPNYYYCYEYQYLNDTYGWSAVTRDIATGEMQATARQAQSDIDNLEIGGRNLARGTAFANSIDLSYWYKNQNPILSVEDGSLKIVGNQTSSTPGAYTPVSVDDGFCTVSFWYKAITSGGAILSGVGLWNGTTNVIEDNCSITIADTEWHYYSHTFELTLSQASSINRLYIFLHQANHAVTDGLYINRLKLEKGNRATDWTPAPEDIDADISTAQTAADNAQATADKNVKESQQLWFTKANGSAPNKPTSKITSTSTSGNAWTTKVPTYSSSYPYYFYCMQYIAADGTVTWSDVVYDQATTEAQSVARTTSANLSTLQSDYATFKQTTQNFESTIGTTYATKTELQTTDNKIENLEIGGRNLLPWSSPSAENLAKVSTASANNSFVTEDGYSCYKITGGNTQGSQYRSNAKDLVKLSADTTYTYSALVKLTTTDSVTGVSFYFNSLGHFTVFNSASTNSDKSHEDVASKRIYSPERVNIGEWTHIVFTFTTNSLDGSWFGVYPKYSLGDAYTLFIRNQKLEKGNKATDWTPAPEDVDAAIEASPKYKYVTSAYKATSQTYNTWLQWGQEGRSITNFGLVNAAERRKLNIGDLACCEGWNATDNKPIYIVIEVTEFPSTTSHINGVSHGLIDSEIRSTVNAIESRVSTAETSIQQNTNSIALKANSSDVYTKTQTDGLISTEVSNRNSAIEQSANAINLSVSQTYTTKTEFNNLEIGGRNLLLRTGSDFFSGTNPAIGGGHVGSATSVVVTDDAYPGFEVLKTTRGNVTSMSGRYMYAITNRTTDGALITGETYTLSFLAKTETEGLQFIASNIVEHIDRISESSMILNSEWTRHWFTFKIKEDGSYISPANCFYTVGTANGIYYITKLKLEKGNKATDWTPAPEDMVSQTEFESAKSEIKTTTDGITSTVSKISSVKYYTGNSSTLANIKVWAAEGYTSTWVFTGDLSNLRVGDTVYLKYGDTTRGCNVYIKGTVNSISGQSVNFTAHGYEDVLPVDTIKSTINQSADSVKIEARHVNIEGAAIFSSGRLSETSLNNAYDTKGAAASLVAGGDNLIGGFNNSYVGNGEYNYRTGRFQSKTTLNTADNAVILQYYSGTTPTSAGTYVGQHSDAFRVANVGETCSFKFEKPSGFTHLHLKFNGNQQDARVAWDVTPIPVGTELILTFKLDSISSDGKGNGGVMSGINLRTGNMPSQWSLAPDDVEIGGRNLLPWSAPSAENYAKIAIPSSSNSFTTEDGYACYKITGGATNGTHYASSGKSLVSLEADTQYTYSAWVKLTTTGSATNVPFNFTSLGHFSIINAASTASDSTHEDVSAKRIYSPATVNVGVWTKIQLTFTTNSLGGSKFGLYPKYNLGDTYTLFIRDQKLEKGNKATDWTPAPEDVTADISAAEASAKEYADGLPAYKVLTTNYSYGLDQWTTYAAEGFVASWTQAGPAKANDTVLIKGTNSDTGGAIYVLVTVNAVNSSGAINNATSHGLIDPTVGQRLNDAYEKIQSRGEQLVVNGNGFMGDNTNFSSLTFDGSVANGSPGSFTDARGISFQPSSDEMFPVDPSKNYRVEFDVTSSGSGASPQMYGMFYMYDVDKKLMNVQQCSYIVGSTTTLARELKNGDTTVYLTDASGFIDTSAAHQRSLIFWDYTNSFGYTYPPETYSRNFVAPSGGLWSDYSKINKTNNTITLTSAWTGGTHVAGTSVSQNSSGATYAYFWSTSNVPAGVWTHVSSVYDGYQPAGFSNASHKFYRGTAYCKIGWLWNYQGSSSNPQRQLWVTNISVREDVATSAELNTVKANTVKRTQRIYYRKSSVGTPSTPGVTSSNWVTQTGDVFGQWTAKVPRLTANADGTGTKYLYLYTCEQREMGDGTLSYTTVLLDDSNTIIDGGTIITGSIAANKLDVYDATIGKISTSAINLTGYAQTDDIPTKVSDLTNDTGFVTNDDIQIGGRNLLRNSKAEHSQSSSTATWFEWPITEAPLDTSQDYTFSFDAKTSNGTDVFYVGFANGSAATQENMATGIKPTTTYTRMSVTARTTKTNIRSIIVSSTTSYGRGNGSNTGGTLYVKNVKLERGNKATDWSPAPEDVDADISSKADPSDIPTKVSDLTNDSGFQDSSQVETAITSKGYATQNSLNSEINQRKAQYGTCSTAAATQAKAVACSNFDLAAGKELTVKFSTANTYASGAVQLNVNSKGAKNVWVANAVTSSSNQLLWGANAYITFRYDGTQFIVIGEPRTWYGASTTAEGTAAKTDTTAVTGCVICKGAKVELAMTNANTATAPTLNIQSTGAKNVYFGNGTARPTKAGGTSWLATNTCTFTFDGQYWRTAGKTYIDANSIVTGYLSADRIEAGSLSANKISATSGTFDTANIPDLSAAKITSGDISADRIKANVISAINSLTAGQIDAGRINASQLSIGQSQVTNLTSDLADAKKHTQVIVSATNVDYAANTCTLTARFYIDGVLQTSTSLKWQWYRDGTTQGSQTTGATGSLSVTSSLGLAHRYACKCTF